MKEVIKQTRTPRTDELRELYKVGRRHVKDVFKLAENFEAELAEARAALNLNTQPNPNNESNS